MQFHSKYKQLLTVKQTFITSIEADERHSVCLSLSFKGPFSRWTWVSWYQNVSILDITGAKDDVGSGDNYRYMLCKALVKQETQLSLTNRATHLQVSQGHQTWYHSIC